MAKAQSPLLGYNTNVRHKGRVFHIQTEDSGLTKPHVITHLFADGGRIVKSVKTSYADLVSAADVSAQVKKLMQDQHKAMFIALRDGEFDASIAGDEEPTVAVAALVAEAIDANTTLSDPSMASFSPVMPAPKGIVIDAAEARPSMLDLDEGRATIPELSVTSAEVAKKIERAMREATPAAGVPAVGGERPVRLTPAAGLSLERPLRMTPVSMGRGAPVSIVPPARVSGNVGVAVAAQRPKAPVIEASVVLGMSLDEVVAAMLAAELATDAGAT